MPAKSTAKTAKSRRPRDSLSRETILAAAETIAERDGLNGLTFQAIGDELNAHPTSMYRHFRDKDDLLLELIDNLRARSYGGTVLATNDWRNDLRAISKQVHEHYLRYPEFAQQMAMRTTRRPVEFANVEFVLDAMRRAGVSDADAVRYQRAFGNLVRSMASIEAAFLALEPAVRRNDELAYQIEYRQLDPEQFPNIARVADPMPGIGDPTAFDTALELLLDAIELRVARASTSQVDH